MADQTEYDLIVLGGGMAGLPIAIRSAHKGLATAMVEQDFCSVGRA